MTNLRLLLGVVAILGGCFSAVQTVRLAMEAVPSRIRIGILTLSTFWFGVSAGIFLRAVIEGVQA